MKSLGFPHAGGAE